VNISSRRIYLEIREPNWAMKPHMIQKKNIVDLSIFSRTLSSYFFQIQEIFNKHEIEHINVTRGVTMRFETAVSEIISAVLLIAVVIGAMGMVSVFLLSTPPPEKLPKTSISAYCVKCVDETGMDDYEILIYNGGGEALERKMLKFFIKTRGIEERIIEVEPYYVYNDIPEYCGSEAGDSPSFGNERWRTSDFWVSGQTLRFFISLPDGTEPQGIFAQYFPYTSNILFADFSSYREKPPDWTPNKDYPKGDVNPSLLPPYYPGSLMPILLEKKCSDGCSASGTCEATFTYITDKDVFIKIIEGYISWNEFSGTGVTPIQSQPTSITMDDSGKKQITAKFKTDIVWKLDRTTSEKAVCP